MITKMYQDNSLNKTVLIMNKLDVKKRNYQAPGIEILKLETEQFIATSTPNSNDFKDGGTYGRESTPSDYGWEKAKFDAWD